MELLSSSPGSADPAAEVRRLRRQLQRERARRLAAESIGERATAELYESVRELRAAQSDLLERADQARVVNDLARALRQDLDSNRLVNHAAESVGRATAVDRCDVLLVDAEEYAAVDGTWVRSPDVVLPRPESFIDLPEQLTALLLDAAQHLVPLQIDDVEQDQRLDPAGRAAVIASLGVCALAAVPIAVGDEVVGWLLLQSVAPRAWHTRELAICTGLSHDLVSSMIQVRVYEQQQESVLRLRELDRAKDSFVSTVSHELRTPLTSIMGYLELISEGGLGPLPTGISQGMEIIERNVDRLRSLVDDLLTLSAYDAAQVRLEVVPMDLHRAVAECRDELLPAARVKEVDVRVEAAAELPEVLADRHHIDRVVQNLLSNAIKFSRDRGVVTLRLRPDAPDVVLEVQDTGIGIPDTEKGRLFQRFFRSSLSVADQIQGTGLGLALVQTVVDWHHGTVTVQSVEGEGTTVTVRLPRAG